MNSILDLIGKTPLIEITKLHNNPNIKIFAKLEGQNPGGSIKDRAALNMVQSALERGDLKAGMTLIEATSGNTGIALAMICNQLDIKAILVMPDNATQERIKNMEYYGAEVILTPANKTIEYSRALAEAEAKKHGYFIANQFTNDDNWGAHVKTTGPEIWKDTMGEITHFVSAMGTTGTIMGVSTFLKSRRNNIQIVGVQPEAGASIPGIRRWSKEFLPKIFNADKIDQIINVSQEEAISTMYQLGKLESISCGVSSGGAMAATIRLANQIKKGYIVCILPDRFDRYATM